MKDDSNVAVEYGARKGRHKTFQPIIIVLSRGNV